MKKSSEIARLLKLEQCSNAFHHLMGHPKNTCVDCLASAIREQVREALEEAQVRTELVDCAGLSGYEVSGRIVTVIAKLIEEVE